MFTKGRFWEDERRKKRRPEDKDGKRHGGFELSEVDLDSMRASGVATSFAASSRRMSGIPSEAAPRVEAMAREGELHETGIVVMPQQIVAVPQQ